MPKDTPVGETPKKPDATQGEREFGEGNYKAARDYKNDIDKFQQTHTPEQIEQAARDAEKAIEGREAEDLNKAEKAGRDRARH